MITNMPLYRNLLSDSVFVYGSSLGGSKTIRSNEAAIAVGFYNADAAVSEGPTGLAYALPVLDTHLQALPSSELDWHVQQFLGHARSKREATFQISNLSLAFEPEKFRAVPDNVFLPGAWLMSNKQLDRLRLFVEGSEDQNAEKVERSLLECTAPFHNQFEVVTTGAGVFNDIVRSWARRKNLPWTPFPAEERFDQEAQPMLDYQLSWYCTHALSYVCPGDADFDRRLKRLRDAGLKVRQIY